jgi:hypothetical protein
LCEFCGEMIRNWFSQFFYYVTLHHIGFSVFSKQLGRTRESKTKREISSAKNKRFQNLPL